MSTNASHTSPFPWAERIQAEGNWTLFLDRDGVLNRRLIGRYVQRVEEFEILPGVLESLSKLAKMFPRIVIVTNQQGIGKGLMTEGDLHEIHRYFLEKVKQAGGRIDYIYYCPDLAGSGSLNRKPEPGMALQAQKDFPEIDFTRSIMVGDAFTDLEMGRAVGMINVWIAEEDALLPSDKTHLIDIRCDSLHKWKSYLC